MNFSLKNTIGVFSLAAVFLNAACAPGENSNQNSSNVQANAAQQAQMTKDDVEELGRIVRLPYAPEEATYRETAAVAPNGKRLTAVLKFSAADAGQIASAAEKYRPSAATQIETEDWFPAELVAQSQLSGDETLRGADIAPNDFFKPPYADGKLSRIADTDYFILELIAVP